MRHLLRRSRRRYEHFQRHIERAAQPCHDAALALPRPPSTADATALELIEFWEQSARQANGTCSGVTPPEPGRDDLREIMAGG
jgi:hypothetical protein